jgi:hypothetical protein
VELAFEGRPCVLVTAPLSVRDYGFSLHAATRADAEDPMGREALLKYILRPPVATERIVAAPDGLVRISLKKPFSDGTAAVDMDPLSLLCRLAATVPPTRFHTVRYAGAVSSHAKWRPLVVPKHASDAPGDDGAPRQTRPQGSKRTASSVSIALRRGQLPSRSDAAAKFERLLREPSRRNAVNRARRQ